MTRSSYPTSTIVLCLPVALGLTACAAAPGAPAPRLEEGSQELPQDAETDMEELAKQTQNPVADLISLPFQNNTDGGLGATGAIQNTTNIQPVYPVNLNDDWLMITRTILPVVYQEELLPGAGSKFGLGDTTFSAFFSPRSKSKTVWGVGPVALLPTSTSDRLGAGEWGLGVSGVALTMPGDWVVGGVVSNVWSFEGAVNFFTLQPFVNYNLGQGWYLVSAPIMTANWEAPDGEQWRVPLGGGAGRTFRIGKLPVNLNAQYYSYVETTSGGPEWQLRLQLQFLFPK